MSSQPVGLIFKKMSDVMKEIKAVTKDQKNTAQGFKFRGIDQFVNALYPALTKHGVFMVPTCESQSHELKDVVRSNGKAGVDKHVTLMMSYSFIAEDGTFVKVGPIPSEGLDSGDKATNKALSAALKYALIQTFSIPTEDMAEADLDTPEIAPSKPKVMADNQINNQIFAANAINGVTTDNVSVATDVQPPAPKKLPTFRKAKQEVASSSNTVNSSTEEWV